MKKMFALLFAFSAVSFVSANEEVAQPEVVAEVAQPEVSAELVPTADVVPAEPATETAE